MTKNTIPIEMPPAAYLFSISRATDAKTLHGLRGEIESDDSLDTEEKAELLASINVKFGQLNLAASKPTERWGL